MVCLRKNYEDKVYFILVRSMSFVDYGNEVDGI